MPLSSAYWFLLVRACCQSFPRNPNWNWLHTSRTQYLIKISELVHNVSLGLERKQNKQGIFKRFIVLYGVVQLTSESLRNTVELFHWSPYELSLMRHTHRVLSRVRIGSGRIITWTLQPSSGCNRGIWMRIKKDETALQRAHDNSAQLKVISSRLLRENSRAGEK